MNPKSQSRQEDLRRLKAGEVTPEQLQKENAFIKNGSKFTITPESLRQAAKFFRSKKGLTFVSKQNRKAS